ncbi:MAG TPA: DegT/DnrJ/EryC1/StrS family aminotransferase [Candidatus Bilamarchaeum sp.]|nr:DegT/DnrJ/EryC1/StrS family aminotransferase [Candidatus Bilamarchaeum sp.]
MVPLDKTIMTREMIDAAADALANEPTLFGESIARFEEEFARFCGTDYAIPVASGTDALIFSLMASGVDGKKVITTPSSYVATANAALLSGAEPVFADIDPLTHNIDAGEVGKTLKKEKKARAVIPVHLHGYPAEMNEIMDQAEAKNIAVIEDAAQAHGAVYFGKRAGAIGHAGCFSFNPVKNMTVGGEAGMIVTNDARIAKHVRMLADAGRENPYTHEHAIVGFSSRLNTVNAAIGRVQLKYLEEWNGDRRRVAGEYMRRLAGLPLGMPPPESGDRVPVYNKFAVSLRSQEERDALRESLYSSGIESDSHYPIPIHLQPPYRKKGYKKGDFPKAERFADTTLSLPLYVGMPEGEIGFVCEKVFQFFNSK